MHPETTGSSTSAWKNRERGMISMDNSLQRLLDDGVISKSEAHMKAINIALFKT
jgi:Tfp pilus assembly ATPase PilU